MPEQNVSESGCLSIAMCDSSSPSRRDLLSSSTGAYYSSMDDSSHNLKHYGGGSIEKSDRKSSTLGEIKTYKRRFMILFLASFCSLMNGRPQFQYTVVVDIVSCFYSVSIMHVNWTCIVFMVIFIPCVFPVMYYMEEKGLRKTIIIGGFLNCLDRYGVMMVSQTIYALAQVFIISLPPFIAGVWFGANEVGLACAIGVLGNQLGVALGFIIPPLVLDNNCTHRREISQELSVIAYPTAVINTVLFVGIVVAFQEKPPSYPSVAQAAKQNAQRPEYLISLKNVCKNVPFILLSLSYGIITGTYFAMSTILNEMVLIHFPGEEVDAGWMGAIMVFTGMVGSILLGVILDKTHRFKELSLLVFLLSFLLAVAYTGFMIVDGALWIQFLFFALLGLVTAGYLPVGFDFAAEITYPEPEAMSASLLNASCQIFSIIITIISSKLIEAYGDTASNIFFCGCLLLGTSLTACIKGELKRTNADELKPV